LIHDGLKFCFPVECIDPQFFFPFKNHALRRFVNIPSDQTISTFDVAVKIGQEPFIEKLCLQVTFVFPSRHFKRSDNRVTSTAWLSMSTPWMLFIPLRFQNGTNPGPVGKLPGY